MRFFKHGRELSHTDYKTIALACAAAALFVAAGVIFSSNLAGIYRGTDIPPSSLSSATALADDQHLPSNELEGRAYPDYTYCWYNTRYTTYGAMGHTPNCENNNFDSFYTGVFSANPVLSPSIGKTVLVRTVWHDVQRPDDDLGPPDEHRTCEEGTCSYTYDCVSYENSPAFSQYYNIHLDDFDNEDVPQSCVGTRTIAAYLTTGAPTYYKNVPRTASNASAAIALDSGEQLKLEWSCLPSRKVDRWGCSPDTWNSCSDTIWENNYFNKSLTTSIVNNFGAASTAIKGSMIVTPPSGNTTYTLKCNGFDAAGTADYPAHTVPTMSIPVTVLPPSDPVVKIKAGSAPYGETDVDAVAGDIVTITATFAAATGDTVTASAINGPNSQTQVPGLGGTLATRTYSFDTANPPPGTPVRIYLTSGSTWTVPSDWNSADNKVELIGGGANGAVGLRGGTSGGGNGGGGGAYAKRNNVSLTPNSTVSYQIGTEGVDTWFSANSYLLAKSASGRIGGTAAASIGSVKYSGGNGGLGDGSNGGGGGGGGAAYPGGAGGVGETSPGTPGGTGGTGGVGGTGGLSDPANGGGAGGAGGRADDWETSRGGGGGGGGGGYDSGNIGAPGGAGGYYGAGGGGGGGDTGKAPAAAAGGAGRSGIIAITYTPVTTSPFTFYPSVKTTGYPAWDDYGKYVTITVVPQCPNGSGPQNSCTACDSGYVLVGGQCVVECEFGTGPQSNCTTCDAGYTEYPIPGPCVPECQNGTGPQSNCTTCNSGYVENPSGQCVLVSTAVPTGMTLSATQARKGSASTVTWNVTGLTASAGTACSITSSPNIFTTSWPGTGTSWSGSGQTSGVQVRTTLTLRCTNSAWTSAQTKTYDVTLLPSFQEI